MSEQRPEQGEQPERDREVVVNSGGSGSNLGIGILIGVLLVGLIVVVLLFLGSGGDDGGVDVPDTLELDVEVDNGDDGGGEDDPNGEDDGNGEEG